MKTFLERDLPVSLKTLGLLNQEDDGGMQQLFEDAAAELTPLLKVELHSETNVALTVFATLGSA